MTEPSAAPVCLFVYKRIESLKQTVQSLLQNELVENTDLHIFSDAPKNYDDLVKVYAVRDFINSIEGFRSVTVYAAEKNKGLARSVIEGVTKIINRYGYVIVLEDDLVVAPNFLCFMNGALAVYRQHPKVFSVAGYTSPVDTSGDIYFTRRSSSWGWATWKNRWKDVDWTVADFDAFINNPQQQKAFNEMGSDLTHMLKKQMNGMINSWAIRWVYHQFKNDLYTVFPAKSKVKNIGFAPDGSHTEKSHEDRFATVLDESGKSTFYFEPEPFLDDRLIQQFLQPYTLKTRVFYKLKSLLHL